MTQPEFDELGAAFSAFHREVGGSTRPATVAQVRSGAQAIRRRRTAAAMIAGVAAAVVLGGSIAYAGQWQQRGLPPAQQQSATPSASASPSSSPSATPEGSATATTPVAADLPAGQPVTCPASGRAASTGPVTAADLCNATLNIPSWGGGSPCPHGQIKLTAGKSAATATGTTVQIRTLANVAVTGTSADDAAVVVDCHVGDPPTEQVVVFSRATGGGIHTVGQVVGLINGQAISVADLHGRTDGTVLVRLFQALGTDGNAVVGSVHQWRGYRFDGHNFTQTSGSTSFDADTTATTLTVAPTAVTFAKGSTDATLKVRVTNTGTTTANDVSVQTILAYAFAAQPNAECVKNEEQTQAVLCHTTSIAPGASWTATIHLTMVTPEQVGTNRVDSKVQLRLGDQHYSDTPITVTVS
jgi:hypothetical protein